MFVELLRNTKHINPPLTILCTILTILIVTNNIIHTTDHITHLPDLWRLYIHRVAKIVVIFHIKIRRVFVKHGVCDCTLQMLFTNSVCSC